MNNLKRKHISSSIDSNSKKIKKSFLFENDSDINRLNVFQSFYDQLPENLSLVICPENMDPVQLTVVDKKRTKTEPVTLHLNDCIGKNYENSLCSIEVNINKSFLKRQSNVFDQEEYKYLQHKGYSFFGKRKTIQKIDRNGRLTTKKVKTTIHPMRMTTFTGSRLCFPFNEWTTVFQKRANDINNGRLANYSNDMCYSSEGLCPFFELDEVTFDLPITDEEFIEYAKCCQEVLKDFFCSNPNVDYRLWILTCLPKSKSIKGKRFKGIKSGCHIIFPNITINDTIGRQLCESISLRIEQTLGKRGIVDSQPYKSEPNPSTLRPAYAMKLKKCLECKNANDYNSFYNLDTKTSKCTICDNRKRHGCGSVYEPKYIFDSNFNKLDIVEELVTDHLPFVLFDTSIISCNDSGYITPGYIVPYGEPVVIPKNLAQPGTNIYKQDFKSMKRFNSKDHSVVQDVGVLRMLSKIVRKYHYKYKDLLIRKVLQFKNFYMINVSSSSDSHKFCRIENFNGHVHNSNSIWFKLEFKDRSIVQFCFASDCKKLLTISLKKKLTKTYTESQRKYLFPKQSIVTHKTKKQCNVSRFELFLKKI
jgi:hypothetical protein